MKLQSSRIISSEYHQEYERYGKNSNRHVLEAIHKTYANVLGLIQMRDEEYGHEANGLVKAKVLECLIG